MKVVLILALACVFVGVAVAQGACGTGALPKCKGPVRAVYDNADCSKDPVTYVQLESDNYEGGKCIALGPNKYDRSVKGSCGTSLQGKTWATNNCEGPYGYGSTPVGKCFKVEGALTPTSFKVKCASASTAAFSAALIALLALFALLF